MPGASGKVASTAQRELLDAQSLRKTKKKTKTNKQKNKQNRLIAGANQWERVIMQKAAGLKFAF